MKVLLVTAALIVSSFYLQAQDTVKTDTSATAKHTISSAQGIIQANTNPIIYYTFQVGGNIAGEKGLLLGNDLNYQFNHHLFTLKGLFILNADLGVVNPLVPIPAVHTRNTIFEASALYGQRFIKGGRAFNFSIGPSINIRNGRYRNERDQTYSIMNYYPGLSFDAGVMWFKSAKRRFRVYHIIPVGKPTGFGGSIGFKLSGNVSKYSFAALGVVYGLGYHKNY
jgi:hypothetical protein